MSSADTYVRARIDLGTKERAAEALDAMGQSISSAIRLLMLQIAEERRLPFDMKVPNGVTREGQSSYPVSAFETHSLETKQSAFVSPSASSQPIAGKSSNSLLAVRPLMRRMILLGANSGGDDTRMWTWS